MKLQYKSTLLIFVFGSVFLVAASIVYYFHSRSITLDSAHRSSQIIAEEISRDMEMLLKEKAKTALTFASSSTITQALLHSNSEFAPHLQASKKITALNNKWMATKDISDPFIRTYLNNPAAENLKRQQIKIPGEYGEIFLTNRYGALVAATNKISTFAHAHKYWWIAGYNNGRGSIYYDDRGFDETVKGYVLGVVVPVKHGGQVIGVLRCNINIMVTLSEFIENFKFGKTGVLNIAGSQGTVFFKEGEKPVSATVADELVGMMRERVTFSEVVSDGGIDKIVTFAPVNIRYVDHAFGGAHKSIDRIKGNKGWFIILSQELDEVLAVSTSTTKLILLVGALFVFLMACISMWLGKRMSMPVVKLALHAKKIGQGDFEAKINLASNDELAVLAESFNKMAVNLRRTMISRDLLIGEIQQRKQAEKALMGSDRKFSMLFGNMAEGVALHEIIYDEDGIPIDYVIINVNPAYEQHTGMSPANAIGKRASELYGMDQPPYLDIFAKVAESGKPIYFETYFQGMQKHFSISVCSQGEGKFATVFEDISERKRTERKLKILAEFSSENPNPVLRIKNDGTVEFANKASGPILEAWSCKIEKCLPGQCLPDDWMQKIHDIYKSQKSIEQELMYKDQTFSITITPFPGTDYLYIYGRDITEHKQAEEEKQKLQTQLAQAHKMESIGRLAGGVAHDFNNILFAINGFAELALQKMDEEDPLKRNIGAILNAGERAADLTQQLLAFSRKQIIKPEVLNLNEVIYKAQKIFGRLIGEDISMKIIHADELWNIKSDFSQIEQVIMNLVVNAKDAMPTGGELTVKTENIVVGKKQTGKYSVIKPGEYISFSVSDTGHGISEEFKDKIFEPFFTTKERGRGTGLGLATVYGIVKQNKGFVYVESKPDEETTFKVYLPRAKGKVQNREDEPLKEMASGSETILVVEDENEVRGIVVKVLSNLGYKVLEAEDGQEALDICKKRNGDLHLLLTDVVMPRMNGGQLYENLKACCFPIKVLFMSGYTDQDIVDHGVLADNLNFLQKPIRPQMLAHSVRRVLDS